MKVDEALENFPCTKCGACCIRTCPMLKDNLCTIYAERPPVCRIDIGYEVFRGALTKREYLEITAAHCNLLQEAFNIGENYRVHLELED